MNRKAHGIFYTALPMAAEITERALKLTRGAFGSGAISALDPACGDGVFLRALGRTLSPAQIYGVDLDTSALALAKAHANTIVHGDAIVSAPLEGTVPLSWRSTFPKVFAGGGFHLIVGNPPFRNVDTLQPGDDPAFFRRWKQHLQTFESPDHNEISWAHHYRRMCDLYHLFFVRALWALRPGGILAFLTSRTWLEAWFADQFRAGLAANATIIAIDDLGDSTRAFADVTLPATVTYLQKRPAPSDHRVQVTVDGDTSTIAQSDLGGAPWRLRHVAVAGSVRLGDLCDLSQGMQTGANSVLGSLTAETVKKAKLETDVVRRRAVGQDIQAGQLTDRKVRYALWTEGLSEDELPDRARAWLEKHRSQLMARAAFRRGNCGWFGWTWPRPTQVDRPKLMCPYRGRTNRFWYDQDGQSVSLTDTTVLLPRADMPMSPTELEVLLNNEDHSNRQLAMAKRTGNGIVEYFATQLAELPIRW
ncbi:MAG: polypeptide subunit release factor methylase [Myxococcota bacterium]|jgi:methylase of polypeptide subunit release factors